MIGGAPAGGIPSAETAVISSREEQDRIQDRVAAWLLPRLGDLVACAIFLAVVGLGPRLMNMDGDLGRHLTVGGYILDNSKIPTVDIFSHSRNGEPLAPHEWLAQIGFTLAYRVMGLDGVVLLSAALIGLTFFLVFRQSVRFSGMPLLGLVLTLLAAAASSLHWLARPHLFTMLSLVIWTGMMEGLRRGLHRRWWSPAVLMLIWANLHGAFVAGFAVWGVYLFSAVLVTVWNAPTWKSSLEALTRSEAVWNWLRLGLAAFAASLINPVGLGVWTMSAGFLGSRYLVSHTAEYLPPDFQSLSAWPFLALVSVSILLPVLSRARLSLTSGLTLVSWTVFGIYSARNIPLYVVVAAPILADLAGQALRAEPRVAAWSRIEQRLVMMQSRLRAGMWPILVLLLAVLALGSGARLDFAQQGNRFDPQVFPVAALDWMEGQQAPGKVFNYFPWGGYLLYREWPDQLTFIDGQTDFYGEAFTRQYEQVITLSAGWEQVLHDYQVDWVLVPDQAGLAQALRLEPGWRQVYQDQTAAIFLRRSASTGSGESW